MRIGAAVQRRLAFCDYLFVFETQSASTLIPPATVCVLYAVVKRGEIPSLIEPLSSA